MENENLLGTQHINQLSIKSKIVETKIAFFQLILFLFSQIFENFFQRFELEVFYTKALFL